MLLENVYFDTNVENTQSKSVLLNLLQIETNLLIVGLGKRHNEQQCHHQKFLKATLKLAKNNRVMFACERRGPENQRATFILMQ